MNKKKERKNWYKLSNVFIHFVRFSDKQITLWTNRKQVVQNTNYLRGKMKAEFVLSLVKPMV
jgi:hypothetical protein